MIHRITNNKAGLSVMLLCLAMLVGCGVPGPNGRPDTFGLNLYPSDWQMADAAAPGGAKGVVVFVVDGVSPEIFDEMLTAGELPAIEKYFLDRGLYVRQASVNTPSVTTANLTSLATGVAPGHHGVIAVNWFDRDQLIWRNYATIGQKNYVDRDYTTTTIYEHLGDAASYSLFFQPHRGSTKFFENALSAGPTLAFGWYELIDRIALHRFGEMASHARQRGDWPAVVMCYMLSPDFRAYCHGLDSPEYRDSLRHTDRQIGRVMGDFERTGMLDELVFAFTSDHGMVNVTEHFPLRRFLDKEVGLDLATRELWENTHLERRRSVYEQHTAVVNCCGNRYAAIALRRPIRRNGEVVGYEPWSVRPTMADLHAYPVEGGQVDLPALLSERQEIQAVAFLAGPDSVRVMTAEGAVQFDQPAGRGGEITYRLIDGRDPLGWARAVPADLLAGAPASPQAWRRATMGLDFADTPMQLPAYFRSSRAGDIAVFAAVPWDLRKTVRAGHGGIDAAEMHVPLLMVGPSIQPGLRSQGVSTLDLVPTILSVLGRCVPDGLDGTVIPTGEAILQAGP